MAVAGLVVATAAGAVSAPAAQAAPGQAAPGQAAPGQAAPARAALKQAAPGTGIKLIAAQRTITATRAGKQVFVDPGIWVASLGAPLQLDVSRASYTQPVTVTQVINQPGLPPQTRALPASILDGWNGLKNFLTLTIKNKAGQVVATTRITLCPNSFDTERARPDSPPTSPFPQQCAAGDPFQLGAVWGIQQGWAVNAAQFGRSYRLGLGTYRVTESIAPAYTRLFAIPPADATVTVVMHVVKGSGCCAPLGGTRRHAAALAKLPAVPVLTDPPASALPDLVPLPAWRIGTTHTAGHDLLNFAATVWVGGNGQLDVQGFRTNSSPVMPAYQYFWQDGQAIGRAPAGTMGIDSKPSHEHWHCKQFADYRLLRTNGNLVLRRHKKGYY